MHADGTWTTFEMCQAQLRHAKGWNIPCREPPCSDIPEPFGPTACAIAFSCLPFLPSCLPSPFPGFSSLEFILLCTLLLFSLGLKFSNVLPPPRSHLNTSIVLRLSSQKARTRFYCTSVETPLRCGSTLITCSCFKRHFDASCNVPHPTQLIPLLQLGT